MGSSATAVGAIGIPPQRSYAQLRVLLAKHTLAATAVALSVAVATRYTALSETFILLAAAVTTITLVVTNFPRMNIDPYGPSAWKLAYAFCSRESIIPLGLAGGLLAAGMVDLSTVGEVWFERAPILWLILTFAVLAYGMERVGFFRYLAILTLLWCRGSVARLTLGFFMLSSGLTYLASNDIVVLVMTPLVIELSRQSGIRDVRLILLVGCFIAANTLSMGMVFGSPSNIIVALATGISFIEYLRLMTVPTVIMAGSSLLTVSFVYAFAVIFSGGLPSYSPQGIQRMKMTADMKLQCGLFAVALVGYSVSLGGYYPFWVVSAPMTLLGLLAARRLSSKPDAPDWSEDERTGVFDALCSLPWGIVGFALSFFVVAQALVNRFPSGVIDWLADLTPVWQLLAALGGTALMANTLNDLPASALIGEMLVDLPLEGWRRSMVLQAVLVGLNAGCYLSPVGALAGLMWFHMLKRDGARYGLVVPKPVDLLWFGGLHFIVGAVLLCGLLPGLHVLWALLTTGQAPANLSTAAVFVSGAVAGVAAIGSIAALCVCLWIMFRSKQPASA